MHGSLEKAVHHSSRGTLRRYKASQNGTQIV